MGSGNNATGSGRLRAKSLTMNSAATDTAPAPFSTDAAGFDLTKLRQTSSPTWSREIRWRAFLAGFLGWTFDAFDFFVLTYVLAQLANEFHRPVSEIAFTLTASLVMRPFGAVLFGILGDRYGRRNPLIANIVFYALVEALSGMAPGYRSFLILRLLFGVGMGGVWGLGASLAMESVAPERRGTFSGILQEGYAIGNLLAAIAFWLVCPRFGWRPLFFLSTVPAIAMVFLLAGIKESSSATGRRWKNKEKGTYLGTIARNGKRALYLATLMSAMGFLSHGSQDLYPTFLQQQLHYAPRLTAIIAVISMLGAIVGGTLGGFFSDRVGRRRTMIIAELCVILLIPLWVFSRGIGLIAAGAFLMQFMVQAAWGVIPAHINELVPTEIRALLPGFAYQLGILIASVAPYIEAEATRYLSYAQSMGVVLAVVVAIGVLVISIGPEARDGDFDPVSVQPADC
jgi:SHS family lactate transporter-like MFS transporter